MWVELSDGRTLGVPLAWFPRLLHASPAQREQVEIGRAGLRWELLDEDISVRACWRAAEMLRGVRMQLRKVTFLA